jgi:hypothetical protein
MIDTPNPRSVQHDRAPESGRTTELQRRIDAALDICDRHERGALRWENPLPVPEWVREVQAALLGDEPQQKADCHCPRCQAGVDHDAIDYGGVGPERAERKEPCPKCGLRGRHTWACIQPPEKAERKEPCPKCGLRGRHTWACIQPPEKAEEHSRGVRCRLCNEQPHNCLCPPEKAEEHLAADHDTEDEWAACEACNTTPQSAERTAQEEADYRNDDGRGVPGPDGKRRFVTAAEVEAERTRQKADREDTT